MLGFNRQAPGALVIPHFSVPQINLAHCILPELLFLLLHPYCSGFRSKAQADKNIRTLKDSEEKNPPEIS